MIVEAIPGAKEPHHTEKKQIATFFGRKVTTSQQRGYRTMLLALLLTAITLSLALSMEINSSNSLPFIHYWGIYAFTTLACGVQVSLMIGMVNLHQDGDPRFDWNSAHDYKVRDEYRALLKKEALEREKRPCGNYF